ncbi:arylsulfatase [Aspergillus venezuelensis]
MAALEAGLDLKLDSLLYMPLVVKHLQNKGIFFNNYFVTIALYCPSRVSLLTSLKKLVIAHLPDLGGYPKFINNYNKPHASGFNGFNFLLDPYTYDYINTTYVHNHNKPVSYLGCHTTKVLMEVNGFSFLTLTPIAPYLNMNSTFGAGAGPLWIDKPIPKECHRHLFPDAKVPHMANFNPKEPTGVSWISKLPYRSESIIEYNDHYYQQRLRALQGVDKLVNSLVTCLENSPKINNTYIIYTFNNDFYTSQHCLPPGKTCTFNKDICVPFFIHGPGIPEGQSQDIVTTYIDIAPTLFTLAGMLLREDFDGTPMSIADGQAMLEGGLSNLGTPTVRNNTYKAVRIISQEYNLFYSVWCNNEHELYDLNADPYQVNNLHPYASRPSNSTAVLGFDTERVIDHIDALLLVLKSCKGRTCIKLGEVLHLAGSVVNLLEALDTEYDAFYEAQPKVSYDWCEYAYIIDAEGPQTALSYRNGYSLDQWT